MLITRYVGQTMVVRSVPGLRSAPGGDSTSARKPLRLTNHLPVRLHHSYGGQAHQGDHQSPAHLSATLTQPARDSRCRGTSRAGAAGPAVLTHAPFRHNPPT